MRVDCFHGFFKFTEQKSGDISDFRSATGFELEFEDGYFTFPDLIAAPNYSIAGNTFLSAACTETIEGKPWDVMRENDLVYDFISGKVVSIDTITQKINVYQSNKYFLSDGMIVAGSLTDEGLRVTDYAAHFTFENDKFKYSEIVYE